MTLVQTFFQRFFRLTPPPMRQAGIQASNSMKPLIGARLGTIVYGVYGRLVRRPEILIAFNAGVERFFFKFYILSYLDFC